jgi:hypothetical protein
MLIVTSLQTLSTAALNPVSRKGQVEQIVRDLESRLVPGTRPVALDSWHWEPTVAPNLSRKSVTLAARQIEERTV